MSHDKELPSRLEYRFLVSVDQEAFTAAFAGANGFALSEYESPASLTIYPGNTTYPWYPVKGTSYGRLRFRLRAKEPAKTPVLVLDTTQKTRLEIKGRGSNQEHKIKLKSQPLMLGEALDILTDPEKFNQFDQYFDQQDSVFSRDIPKRAWPNARGFLPLAMTQYIRREAVHTDKDIRLTIDFDITFWRVGKVKAFWVAKQFSRLPQAVVELKVGAHVGIDDYNKALEFVRGLFPPGTVSEAADFTKFDVLRDAVNASHNTLREVKPDAVYNQDLTEYELKYTFPDDHDIFVAALPSRASTFCFNPPEKRQNNQCYFYDPNDTTFSIAHNTDKHTFKYKKQLKTTKQGIIHAKEHFSQSLDDILVAFSLQKETLQKTKTITRSRQLVKVVSLASGYTYVVVADKIFAGNTRIFQELEVEFNGVIQVEETTRPDATLLQKELLQLDKIVREAYAQQGVALSQKSRPKFESIMIHGQASSN